MGQRQQRGAQQSPPPWLGSSRYSGGRSLAPWGHVPWKGGKQQEAWSRTEREIVAGHLGWGLTALHASFERNNLLISRRGPQAGRAAAPPCHSRHRAAAQQAAGAAERPQMLR